MLVTDAEMYLITTIDTKVSELSYVYQPTPALTNAEVKDMLILSALLI